jgi:hypothetical protein
MQRKITIIGTFSEDEEVNIKNQLFTKLNRLIADIGNIERLIIK